jgi:hypothetical protein
VYPGRINLYALFFYPFLLLLFFFKKKRSGKNIVMKEIPVLPLLYDFIVWYTAKISQYPKKYKYSIGERILNVLLDILEALIEARFSSGKKAHFLRRANLGLEKLRFLLRLSKDIFAVNLKSYEYAIRQIDEMGRMVGGWEKHSRGREGQA